jgi:formate dehydrogenase iron-sulfur subunit
MVQCKRFNELDYDLTQPEPILSGDTWLVMNSNELTDADGNLKMRYARDGCKHCLDPGCVRACPADAVTKDATYGSVTVDYELCIGCKSCTVGKGLEEMINLGCPFDIPQYGTRTVGTEEKTVMLKCRMCIDRLEAGSEPTCATMCPTGAITFGDRDAKLTEAKNLMAADTKYVGDHVYGETEAGGISVFVIADVAYADMGLKDVPPPEKFICSDCNQEFATAEELEAHKDAEHKEEKKGLPTWGYAAIAAGAVAVIAIGGYALYKRKEKVAEEQDEEEEEEPKKKGGKKGKKKGGD